MCHAIRSAAALVLVFALGVAPAMSRAEDPTPPADDTKDVLYALGIALSQSLDVFSLTEEELGHVVAGLRDAALKKTLRLQLEPMKPKLRALAQARARRLIEAEKRAAAEVIAKAAAEPGAQKTESGLVYRELQAGTGPSPKASDRVRVHYHGTLRDGTVFDSSVQRKEPATFPLDGVIPCWTEGVQKMKVGGKARLTCPSKLAYGERGSPPNIRPGAALTFEVELLEIPAADKTP
jgi:FKBP-type peptidyl-prolyl cis-trans isomerase FkpA/FKBP-type peptidyl-prolyl cis-trans isomerase FklB